MYCELNLVAIIKLLLRRSVRRSDLSWTIASQFTRNDVKGALLYDMNPGQLRLEVQMIVFTAIRIKGRCAIWTVVAWLHIFVDRQFRFTDPAKNCFCVPLIFTPCFRSMTHRFLMTLIAGVIFVTTFELYGNYINRRVIMLTPGIVINHLPIYFNFTHQV